MELGAGLLISEVNLPLLNNLPLDFVVPYFHSPTVDIDTINSTYPQLEIKGEALLSAHEPNNRYMGDDYTHLRNKTRLETEQFILNDILETIEKRQHLINQWEVFNEVVRTKDARRKCELWGNEFYAQIVRAIRQTYPDKQLIYSDYNCVDEGKMSAIYKLINELNLDGIAIQLHLSLVSKDWIFFIASGKLEDLTKQFHDQGKKVTISEAGIRIHCPHTFAVDGGEMIRKRVQVKDLFQMSLLSVFGTPEKRIMQRNQWKWLINYCESIGVDEFYCFKADASFSQDEPSLIDKDYQFKI